MHADNLKALLFAQLDACEDATTLRTLVKIADEVIEYQDNELEATYEVCETLTGQLVELGDDADRYQLLKRIIGDMLVVAAYTGAQAGHKAVEAFKKFDVSLLDSTLDNLIEAGLLDELEERETAQSAAEAGVELGDDEPVGYAAAGPAYRDELLPQGVLSDEY